MNNKRAFFITLIIVALFLSLLLLNSHNITPAPHLDDLDSGALLDSLYAVALAGLVLFIAAGLGRILIKPFKLTGWTFIERMVIGLPLGLATIGYVEFFMGLLGLLTPIHHIALLIVLAIIAFANSVAFVEEGFSCLKQFPKTWQGFSVVKKIFFSAGALALLLALAQTLTPPYDYDGLMYHLQGPRLFLEAGRIIPIPENWFTYYPSTWEMVYMLGMGVGSDIFARLIHFTTLMLFLFATYAFGKRFLPASGGWLPAAILVGIPILLVWGTFAYTDLAWALFQFLAIGLVLMWIVKEDQRLLVLAGIMQGLALGSKYVSLSGLGILGLCIIWFSFGKNGLLAGIKRAGGNVFQFGFTSLLIASPWLLKNLLWTGNPVFPYYFPQEIINPNELNLVMDYIDSFGTGKELHDYLLLPINIFLRFTRFSTFLGNIEIPNPVFLLSFAYPFIRKKNHPRTRLIFDVLAIITFGQFIFWALGSQQNRFLLPLFPGLSIITSNVVLSLTKMTKKIRVDWVIKTGAIGGMIIASLVIVLRLFMMLEPYKVALNFQTKSQFLSSFLNNYDGLEFVNTRLPTDAFVLMPWDGRGYYCDGRCYPDVGPSVWTALIKENPDITMVSEWLKNKGITHIFLSNADVSFYLYTHDLFGDHERAVDFLIGDFAPICAVLIYSDNQVQLFELSLGKSSCY